MFNRLGYFNIHGFNRLSLFVNIASAAIKFYLKTKDVLVFRVRS